MRRFYCVVFLLIAIFWGNHENSLSAENAADNCTLAYCPTVNGKFQIYIMNGEGNKPMKLTESTQEYEENMDPVWSPTEKKLLFRKSLSRNKNELWLADLEWGTQVKITDNLVSAPVKWSPDGSKVLFITGEKKKWVMAIYHVETGLNTFLTGEDTDLVEDSNYSWAPDSQRVVAVFKCNNKKDLYVLNVETKQMQKLTRESGDQCI